MTFKIIYILYLRLGKSCTLFRLPFIFDDCEYLFLSFPVIIFPKLTNPRTILYWSTIVQEGLYPSPNPFHQSVDRAYLYACMRMHTRCVSYVTQEEGPLDGQQPPNWASSSFVSNLAKEKCERCYVAEKWEKTDDKEKKKKTNKRGKEK